MNGDRREGWLSLKQALEFYKREHRRITPPGCRCPLCLSPEELEAQLAANQARLNPEPSDAPF